MVVIYNITLNVRLSSRTYVRDLNSYLLRFFLPLVVKMTTLCKLLYKYLCYLHVFAK